MHEEWTDKLSDYLDDELPEVERDRVKRHVATCAECARILDELSQVVATASALPIHGPADDLWNGIAAQIAARTPAAAADGRRRVFTWAQLAAASVLLALFSGWFAMRLIQPEPQSGIPRSAESRDGAAAGGQAGPEVMAAAGFDDAQYVAAVNDLREALQQGRGRLDAQTIATVEEDVRIIDEALDESRRALAQDPADGYLSGHLVKTAQRKLDVLRQAAALSADEQW
jgi:anti-sigma factor RsiW